MSGLGISTLGRAAPGLGLERQPRPFVLMLDDLHELQPSACHDVLGVVIASIPRGLEGQDE